MTDNEKCYLNAHDMSNTELGQSDFSLAVDNTECSANDHADCKPDVTDALLCKLALWIMNMEAKCHIPSSTVQSICEELRSIHSVRVNNVRDIMSVKLTAHNIDANVAVQVHECLRSSPLNILLYEKGVLQTEQSRKSSSKDKFNYVELATLSLESNKSSTQIMYHYIPILASLKALFKDRSI
jgi:hypothetical protein